MKRRSKGGHTRLFRFIGEALRRVGEETWAGRHGQAALSGSKAEAPGSAGGYLLSSASAPRVGRAEDIPASHGAPPSSRSADGTCGLVGDQASSAGSGRAW